jgi:hypothetical protein
MIHYYVQKGRMPSEIYNAPEGEKAFLYASMLVEMENSKNNAGICPLLAK